MTTWTSDAALTRIHRARSVVVTIVLILVVIAVSVPIFAWPIPDKLAGVAAVVLFREDLPLLPFVMAPLLLRLRPDQAKGTELPSRDWRLAVSIALLMLILCWWGHYAVLDHWGFSRDEQLADFDAAIFSHARLLWPLPAAWQPLADSLNQTFILPIGHHDAWISNYLPINSAFRALVGTVADPALTSPLFVALGALSLWRVSLRLFPNSPASPAVALILYAGSSQIWLTGMTSYAMSAHLGLNLLWLALFLRDDWRGHAGAMGVGFLATGLHQPLFHPLFALPFLGLLWGQQRWRLIITYIAAYAVIGLFWTTWPVWMHAHGSTTVTAQASVGYVDRLFGALRPFTLGSAWLTAANLLRFLTWQHLMLLPLLAIGVSASWDRNPMARTLAISLGLPILVMALLLPQQGHGWGYRYMHGVIGNACLLGAYGWQWLEANGRAPRRALIMSSLATLLIVIPVHAWMAHEAIQPEVEADKSPAPTPAKIAIIDNAAVPFANDLVLNRPDLSNRPIRLAASALDPTDIASLCRMGTVGFFDAPALEALGRIYGVPPATRATSHQLKLKAAARSAGCVLGTEL